MLDFAGSELLLIGVVSLILIGPKDMPAAIRTITGFIKKARKMASEFQSHVDEMVKEADLQEVHDQFKAMRRMNLKSQIMNVVDGDGSLHKTFAEDPVHGKIIHPPIVSSKGDIVKEATQLNQGPPKMFSADYTASSDLPVLEEEYVPDVYQSKESEQAVQEEVERLTASDPAPVFVPPAIALELQRERATPPPPFVIPPSHLRPYDHYGRPYRKET